MKIEIVPPVPAEPTYKLEVTHSELTLLRVTFGNFGFSALVDLVCTYGGNSPGRMSEFDAKALVNRAGGTGGMFDQMSAALRGIPSEPAKVK